METQKRHYIMQYSIKAKIIAAKLAIVFGATTCLGPSLCSGQCIPFSKANDEIGATRCITGKGLKVEEGQPGVTYLDFCEDHRRCPFTVVGFPSDLRHVGDVRALKDKLIEVRGDVKQYDGYAEIILSRPQPLRWWGVTNSTIAQRLRCRKTRAFQRRSVQTREAAAGSGRQHRRYRSRVIFWMHLRHTIPLLNSSREYLVPRHSMPSFLRVKYIERSIV